MVDGREERCRFGAERDFTLYEASSLLSYVTEDEPGSTVHVKKEALTGKTVFDGGVADGGPAQEDIEIGRRRGVGLFWAAERSIFGRV